MSMSWENREVEQDQWGAFPPALRIERRA
jgi:hypothetical protein